MESECFILKVNELQRKELAETLAKLFAHHRKLCRRVYLRFNHCNACRSGLGLGTYVLYLTHVHSHIHKCRRVPAHTHIALMSIHIYVCRGKTYRIYFNCAAKWIHFGYRLRNTHTHTQTACHFTVHMGLQRHRHMASINGSVASDLLTFLPFSTPTKLQRV